MILHWASRQMRHSPEFQVLQYRRNFQLPQHECKVKNHALTLSPASVAGMPPQQTVLLAVSAKHCMGMRTRSVLVGAPTVFPSSMALSCQAVGPASKAGPKSLESPAGVGNLKGWTAQQQPVEIVSRKNAPPSGTAASVCCCHSMLWGKSPVAAAPIVPFIILQP